MPQWSRRRALHAVAATATTAREERVFAPFWLEEYENEANRPSRPVGDALVTEPPSFPNEAFQTAVGHADDHATDRLSDTDDVDDPITLDDVGT